MTHATGHVVRIERTFAAPAEAVFDAWTNYLKQPLPPISHY